MPQTHTQNNNDELSNEVMETSCIHARWMRKKCIHNFKLKMEKIEQNQQQGEVMTGDWRR